MSALAVPSWQVAFVVSVQRSCLPLQQMRSRMAFWKGRCASRELRCLVWLNTDISVTFDEHCILPHRRSKQSCQHQHQSRTWILDVAGVAPRIHSSCGDTTEQPFIPMESSKLTSQFRLLCDSRMPSRRLDFNITVTFM